MNDREYAVYQALDRARVFGTTHAANFPQGSAAPAKFARVQAILTEVGYTHQVSGLPGTAATHAKEHLLDELRDDLLAIAHTARAIGRSEPGFERNFRMGGINQRETLATTASFLEHLANPATVAKFVACDLPADFVTQLAEDLDTVASHIDDQMNHRQSSTGTTARVRELMVEARDLLKTLDASVKNRFRDQAEVLAAWRTAARIHRPNRDAAVPASPLPPTN